MIAYLIFTLTIGGIYALLALSLNLIWGGIGLVNLGLAGFFAIGAYTSAILSGAGEPILLGWSAAIVVGALAGAIVTLATSRLRDDYLAIVTLGLAEVIRLIAANEIWLTKGTDGMSGIAAPFKALLGGFGYGVFYLALVTVIVIAVWVLLRRIDRSPYGRVAKAIREDHELVGFAGKAATRFKVETFALSAAIAGLAGALYAHFQSYISPDHFEPMVTIDIFLAIVAGGLGRPAGGVIGAYAVVGFLELTRFGAALVPWLEPVQTASLREMLVGIALLLILRWRPQGMLAEFQPPAFSTQMRSR